MSWEQFWAPNIVQATLFAAISGLVSGAVVFFVRRWVSRWLHEIFGEQQRTTNAAEAAASRSGEALDAAHAAVTRAEETSADARTAADNSRQANAAIEWLAQQLATKDAAVEELRERVDRLLGTRARQLAAQGTALPAADPLPDEADEDPEALTITGRHRLRTQMLATINPEDPE